MILFTIPSTLTKPHRRNKTRLPPVFVMTDEQRLPDPLDAVRRMPAGWGLIFRHYTAQNRADLASRTAAVCRHRNVTLLIAGDWRLADRVNADGVHVPEHTLARASLSGLRLWRRTGKLITASAHDAQSLHRADRFGADGILLSPVEATTSHPDRRPLGPHRFAALTQSSDRPVIALGGVPLRQHTRLIALGAVAIAGINLLEEI